MVIGLVLAAVAAVAFGTGTFVQHLSTREVEHPDGQHATSRGLIRLLVSLVHRPKWLFGQALAGGGTATQFAALGFAPVAVVEPIVGAGLVVALSMEAVRLRRRPSGRLLLGLALCVGGLVVFLLFSRASEPRRAVGLGGGLLLLGLGLGLGLVSRVAPSGRVGAVVSGTAAGGTLGVAVVAVAVAIHDLQRIGLWDLFTTWRPYVAAGVGIIATAATQQAFARGRLAWSLPALTVADPLTATLLSVLFLGEHLVSSAAPFWAAGAAVAVLGVVLTATTRGARRLTGEEEHAPAAGGAQRPSSARLDISPVAGFRSTE